jgi:hypothetical protein
MSQLNELPIPPVAKSDGGRELLRVWAASGVQHVSIATGIWKDPAAWGIMIVDLMKHISKAYEQTAGFPTSETFQRIIEGMQAELSEPTDSPTGELNE